MKKIDPFSSITSLPSIGPKASKRLFKLGIVTIRDFLYHFPHRYENYSKTKTIDSLVYKQTATVRGEIIEIKNIYTKGFKKLTKLILKDKTGELLCVFFNQRFLIQTLKKGQIINVSGEVGEFNNKISLISPNYEVILNKDYIPIHTQRLVPIYPETARISSKWIRLKEQTLLNLIDANQLELIPKTILETQKLISLKKALRDIHFPETLKEYETARKRFAFEELFTNQLLGQIKKEAWKNRGVAKKFIAGGSELLDFMDALPFKLTSAQINVSKDILKDLSKNKPSNRLIQGDVGSGKTVVSALAMYIALKSNSSSLLMAPTEILANQHYKTIKELFGKLNPKIPINIITGANKSKIDDKRAHITIGTHAIINRKKLYKNVGVIIIDEQHKFGVEQRGKILKIVDQKHTPHLITMTATPIPRSLALTAYGQLDISTIDKLPPGRIPIKTFVVPEEKRQKGYEWIKNEVEKKENQAYIICPFVEESYIETLKNVKAATKHFEELKKIFKGIQLDMVHGKMKSDNKDKVINNFRSGKVKILVATPVVEVGVDIPNANIMIIEGAERFGLASLHQLRGRIGRKDKQAYCFLFPSLLSKQTSRIKKLEEINNGLKLAELDLKIRGPGEFYGLKQHGKNHFRFADFSNINLIEKSYKSAEQVSKNINMFPQTKHLLKSISPDTIMPN